VPAGAWAAAIWLVATVNGLRGYTGLPGMPSGLPALPTWSWALVACAVVAGPAGCWLLRRRPLPALGLLIGGTAATAAALSPLHSARAENDVLGHLLAVDVAFGFVVVARPLWQWAVAFPLVTAVLPGCALLRSLIVPQPATTIGAFGDRWMLWFTYGVMPAVVAGLVGYVVRQTRRYADQLTAHAASQAVTAERLRISRELHDLVAHSIGVIALQAGAAARVVDTQPDKARDAMLAVTDIGRQTLSGLRRMVGALRDSETAGDPPSPAPLRPALGLADVDDLAAATTAAGVRVDVRRRGAPRPLPPDIDLSAYRIVQEALANVIRHAGTRDCEVSVDYRDAELAIEVTDQGRGGDAASGDGYGLAGMRERVALLRGSFWAGPTPGGGFRVTARLPTPEPAGLG
jgi:signal transduction histidine kinase